MTLETHFSHSSRFSIHSGVPIRSSFDDELTRNLVTQLHPFLDRIKRTIHRLSLKELVELRLTTTKFVYLLRSDSLCSFIVVQKHDKSRYEIAQSTIWRDFFPSKKTEKRKTLLFIFKSIVSHNSRFNCKSITNVCLACVHLIT